MIRQFHKCSAWIDSCVPNCERFYSYDTHIATAYRYHRFAPAYQSFYLVFLRPDATLISATTTRQLSRYLTEKVSSWVSVYDVRDMQRCGFGSFVDYDYNCSGMNVLKWFDNPRRFNNHIEERRYGALAYGGTLDDIDTVKCALYESEWSW